MVQDVRCWCCATRGVVISVVVVVAVCCHGSVLLPLVTERVGCGGRGKSRRAASWRWGLGKPVGGDER